MDICVVNSEESLRLMPIHPCDVISLSLLYSNGNIEKEAQGEKQHREKNDPERKMVQREKWHREKNSTGKNHSRGEIRVGGDEYISKDGVGLSSFKVWL